MIDRRKFLVSSALCLGGVVLSDATAPVPAAWASDGPDAAAFSFDDLVARMKARAGQPYEAPPKVLPDQLSDLSYDEHRAIRYVPERALWRGAGLEYEMQAFHPGWLFDTPVEIVEVSGGAARPLHFTGADFEYRAPLDAAAMQTIDLPGVAGFRLHYPINRPDYFDELLAFLGASYFRALGRGNIYGLSARGLAIDTAAGRPEEFPRFSRFYLERPEPGQKHIRLWAELDSERVAGAYAFTVMPGVNTEIEVDARIFFRDRVERLGIAPLTSMYLFGENDRTGFDDYRPEVHDSDGLMMLRRSGERLWRPLLNPRALGLSFFYEESLLGFGLMQRDRDFDSYQDTEAHYERRPSLWIEPLDDWGAGHVMLAEIPSDREIHDNIAAFWIPATQPEAGSDLRFRYRMVWGSEPEPGFDLASVLRTRTGHAGTAASNIDPSQRKFVVEFQGEQLARAGGDAPVEPKFWCQNAHLLTQQLQWLDTGVWRFIFDLQREDDAKPVEMTLALTLNGRTITETWMYQWNQMV
ncbi:glucan biosynthesis protein [Polymorphum gilvum]|uniref:Glucans biosynthesis protein G n=1 Tax=Polymorphum gilvum (strain LMG 25793 / CGMCC 1.9160 / SL003B-26A1) TaxID=991905 RepID=F2J496_POLGS|nr:glucan biosynthesis protein [Polymorphum gilvum]ADZ71038.1 glucan biosynthesis protein G [Polymorphum gilvum SL003B-26A1]